MKKITIFTLYSYLDDNLHKTKKTEKVHLWLVAQASVVPFRKKHRKRLLAVLFCLFQCASDADKQPLQLLDGKRAVKRILL